MSNAAFVLSSGGTGAPPVSTVAPGDALAITVTGFIDPVSGEITLQVGITPPAMLGTFTGCHIYLEVPDQSAAPAFTVGVSALGGTDAVTGPWVPIDCGYQVYVAAQQPWTITGIPGPPGIDPTVNTPARIYCVSVSAGVENTLVRADQAGPSPNQTFELVSLDSGSPTAGTNVTGLTTVSGALVGIVATALAPVNVTGKLQTPVEVLVTDVGTAKGWCYQLVLTFAGSDPTVAKNQFVMTGVMNQAGPVPAGADGVSIPHSFLLDTPTAVTQATVWLQAGLVGADGVFQGNNIVPGITPQFGITYGSTVGTTDASAIMAATIAASMSVVNGLFGVAAAGITNSLLGANAVATINVQNLAITNPLLASLAVQAANLATGSVTATAIGAAAVGTAAIQTAAITNALIANLAVSGAQIQSATITGANIASATIAGANIGTATIAQANLANLSVGTAQVQSAAITGAKIASATITDANIGTCSVSKLIAGTATFTGTVNFTISGGMQLVLSSSVLTIYTGLSTQSVIITPGGLECTDTVTTGGTTLIQGNQIALNFGTGGVSPSQLAVTWPGSGIVTYGTTLLAGIINLTNGNAGANTAFALNVQGTYTASSATAGSDTLPGNPAGFLVVTIDNATRKIPYYAN